MSARLKSGPSGLKCCLLTPGGRGAVAVIGLRGEISRLDRWFQAANRKQISEQQTDRICFGEWGEDHPEEVVIVRTSSSSLEVHCHGGPAAIQRILGEIESVGGKIDSAGEWLLEETELPDAVDSLVALTRATTTRTAHHLLRQSNLYAAAVAELSTLSEAERSSRIAEMLRWSDFGLHLTHPWKVVLCGRPNVGKSSLINAMVGFTRSVVFDQPGTTRDVVAVETAFEGWPIELSDTAGLRSDAGELEAAGIELARQRMGQADVLLVVLDASAGVEEEDLDLLQTFPDSIVVWNKTDLVEVPPPLLSTHRSVAVSAQTGKGMTALIDTIVQQIVPEEPLESTVFPVTIDQIERLKAL